jgi:hypothetical protein
LPLGPISALPRGQHSHVIVLVMENREYTAALASSQAPYVSSLARRYGVMTRAYAIAHPSLPNYLALTSGSTHGIRSDCSECLVHARNLVDQMEAAGVSWRAYLEDYPGRCFTGAGAGGYAKKHNPFAYYADVIGSPARCSQLVGFPRLAADLRAGRLPTFAWISPNLCDDGHDCSTRTADGFLARTVPALLRELGPRGLLVLTWDEGSSGAGCCGDAAGGHIAVIAAGAGVRAGARAGSPIDHYGVLASIEEALGLPPLGAAANTSNGRLSALFARAPRAP